MPYHIFSNALEISRHRTSYHRTPGTCSAVLPDSTEFDTPHQQCSARAAVGIFETPAWIVPDIYIAQPLLVCNIPCTQQCFERCGRRLHFVCGKVARKVNNRIISDGITDSCGEIPDIFFCIAEHPC